MAPTINQEKIIAAIRAATTKVFSTMLSMEIVPCESSIERSAGIPSPGIVALVGLAGSWVGSGTVACTAACACQISSAFLMAEYTSVNEEVLDAIAELVNMIIGNVKNSLEEDLGPMGLSIPTVVYGRNFTTRSLGANDWIVVPFKIGEEDFGVRLCLSPSRGESGAPKAHSIPALI